MSLSVDACDVGALIVGCVKSADERARQRGCAVDLRAEPSIVGRWDRTRLRQVVEGLLDNAIKFGDGKPIEVDLARDGKDAILKVCDHGVGIPEDRLSSIFLPFERVVPKEHFGGLGLGLHIAKAIAEAHAGSIAVQSRLGQGSTFVVRLPLSRESREGP